MVALQGSVVVALGVGALVGGVAGALLTGWIGASEPRSEPLAARPSDAPALPRPEDGRDDQRLELLLGTLIEEVQALRTSLGPGRQSAGGNREWLGGPDCRPRSVDRVPSSGRVAARREPCPSTAAWRRSTSPAEPRGSTCCSSSARSRTTTSACDPSCCGTTSRSSTTSARRAAIWPDDRWMYEVPATGEQVEFRFQYGLLISIY